MKQAILKKKYSNISTADYGIPAVRPEGGKLSMDKMIPEINRAIERKYQDIKETGKIYSGIKSLYETIAWEDPQLASYVRQKMMKMAEANGDLP